MIAQEGRAPLGHGGMDDFLQPGERSIVAEDPGAQCVAKDAVGPGAAGKGGLDRRDQRAARPLHRANLAVGVEDGDTGGGEHGRDRGLAHPDRPGEPDDERPGHRVSRARRSASCSRGAGWPKKSSKAAAA